MQPGINKITIEKQECTRCGKKFWPKVDDKTDKIVLPNTCRNKQCNSPYWMNKKTRFV